MRDGPKTSASELGKRIDVARGLKPAELVLKNAKYLDVFSCRWKKGDIAIDQGRIVGVSESYKGRRQIDLKGQAVVPGFIDSHVHIESSMMSPDQFELACLTRGTTSAIVDPHEIVNVLGLRGLEYILDAASDATMDIHVMLSSCVPATNHLETSGAKVLAKDLLKYKDHPRALGLAEMMNFPGVLHKDPEVLEKIVAFSDGLIDGHCPMLRGKELNAYIGCGISSCHESVSVQEAREKLEKGMQVLLREGSVAKNLKQLVGILTPHSSPKVSLCTDDRNPVDILDEGHINFLVRLAIQSGVEPSVAYRSASWSTANAYGLKGFGAIAPGYFADLVVMKDLRKADVNWVMKAGRIIKSEKDVPKMKLAQLKENSVRYQVPPLEQFKIPGPEGVFRVIEVIPNQIITKGQEVTMVCTNGEITSDLRRDILKIAVLERHGKGHPLAVGLVKGFGLKSGAIGSTVGHDSHNAVGVGTCDIDMQVAFEWLKSVGGGFCAVKDGRVLAGVELPIAGLMTDRPLSEVYTQMKKLKSVTKKLGSGLHEPFLQLAFLCLPVIPDLKITDKGLVDVNKFERVSLRV